MMLTFEPMSSTGPRATSRALIDSDPPWRTLIGPVPLRSEPLLTARRPVIGPAAAAPTVIDAPSTCVAPEPPIVARPVPLSPTERLPIVIVVELPAVNVPLPPDTPTLTLPNETVAGL